VCFLGTGPFDLVRRYLWAAQAVDSLLADETIDGTQTADDILWPLADHLNTTRDVLRYNTSTDTVSVTNHLTYDAFGNVTSETSTASADDTLFHHTGKILDEHTGNQWHNYRWYNPETATWQSADPIGFAAGDANLYRYVGNNVLVYVDPHGLQPPPTMQRPGEPSSGGGIGPAIGLPSIFPDPSVQPPENGWPPSVMPPGIGDWIEDPEGAMKETWEEIQQMLENGWIETIDQAIANLPNYQFADEVGFSYRFGKHTWEIDAQCCGLGSQGAGGLASLKSRGEFGYMIVVPKTLQEWSGNGIDVYSYIDAQIGAQLKYDLIASTSQSFSLGNGCQSSSEFEFKMDAEFGGTGTIGVGTVIGDVVFDNFSVGGNTFIQSSISDDGTSWTHTSVVTGLLQMPIGTGSLQVGGFYWMRQDDSGSFEECAGVQVIGEF
jgi:RHS repeat-associated protein